MTIASHTSVAGVLLDDRFTDVRVLEAGRRFTIFEAFEPSAGRTVSIKTPSASGASWVDDVLDQEAEVLAAIGGHPNIVTLFQRLVLPHGRPALVLAPCGGTLEASVHAGERVSHADAVAIGIKLAGALETAHQANVVHRDVRPGNVLVDEFGQPVLTGFHESARIGSALGAGVGSAPLHVTTPNTAPELLEGADPTPASDVYGLAATIYELIAGRTAFRAYAGESPAAVIVRVLSNPVRPIIAPDVPIELSDLLTWGMAANPSHRPPSPAWLAEDLGRIARRQGWPRTAMTVS